ncbi:hypothetical protein F5Y13DRAFT_188980 [Hypoxylon sp. FL1857]|nr:hypothetical protein F5Y13DRAFT_188980 [Hypoxylon sp. FL1857]
MLFKAIQILGLAAVAFGLPVEQPPSPITADTLTVTNTLRDPHFTVSWDTLSFPDTPGFGPHIKKQEPTGTSVPPPSLTGSPNWPSSGYPVATGSWPTFPYSSGRPSFTLSHSA